MSRPDIKADDQFHIENIYLRYFLNVMSLNLREVERYFLMLVSCLKTEGNLNQQQIDKLNKFASEEAAHLKYHELYNKSIQHPHHYYTQSKIIPFILDKNKALKTIGLNEMVGMARRGEYLTSYLSVKVFPRILHLMNEPCRNLWGWHLCEEVEHGGDLDEFEVRDRSIFGQVYLALQTVCFFYFVFIAATFFAAFRDGKAFTIRFWRDFFIIECKYALMYHATKGLILSCFYTISENSEVSSQKESFKAMKAKFEA